MILQTIWSNGNYIVKDIFVKYSLRQMQSQEKASSSLRSVQKGERIDATRCMVPDGVTEQVYLRTLERAGSPLHIALKTRGLLRTHFPHVVFALDEIFLGAFPCMAEEVRGEYAHAERDDILFAAACVRQGWVHLLSVREVTTPKPLIDGPDSNIAHLLVTRIPCDQYRALLTRAEAEGNVTRIAAYEKMIAHHIFAEVALFDQWREKPSAWQEEHETPSYVKGYPSYIVSEKDGSCFSGIWLIATLLLRCGLSPEKLRYCHVNQSYDGQLGPHAQLLLLTSNREIMSIDHGYGSIGRHLSPAVWDNRTFIDMTQLLNGERTEPVIVHTPKEQATLLQCPRSMIVSPLFPGVASEHYWHVGIEFLHEGKLPEARRALEYAQMFCPKNPDVLYYLGLVASQEGNSAEARVCFEGALTIFEGHLRSHYALGELAEHVGNMEEVQKRHVRVGESWDSVWGDSEFLEIARRKLDSFPPPKDPLTYQI